MAKLPIIDRMFRALGRPVRSSSSIQASSSGYAAFAGAALTRLNGDWIGSLLSPDRETQGSLKILRKRCRQLHNNNDYARRFVNLAKKNVIGSQGVQLESQLEQDADELADEVNDEVERAWRNWTKKGNCTVDGELSFIDVLNIAIETLIVDGEVFIRKVMPFAGNEFNFALQFIDADQVDTQFNMPRRQVGDEIQNEIRMGIEVDQYGRRLAYWIYDGHPSEGHVRRVRVPASEMMHLFLRLRFNQSRGVPWFVTAMTRLNMLGGYEEAELVAARLEACKMGFFVSGTGEEFTGRRDTKSGAVTTTAEPGSFDQLPDGVDFKAWDPQHPNGNFGEFVKTMLRGAAVGLDCSYASLAGDMREVNFSSIRAGILEERETYKALQTFIVDHFCQPLAEAVIPVLIMEKQCRVPTSDLIEILEELRWQTRGWSWVDPLKDVEAAIAARGCGSSTLADICAAQGRDWRDNIDQIAIENAYAKEKGVDLNFARPSPASIGETPAATPEKNPPKVPLKEGEEN